MRPPLMTKEVLSALFCKRKMSIKQISLLFGVTQSTILNYIDCYGLEDSLIGRRFDKLVVIGKDGIWWKLKCDCGEIVMCTRMVDSNRIKTGYCGSCIPKKRKIGRASMYPNGFLLVSEVNAMTDRTNNVWSNIISRCGDVKNKDYGGRGITVCDRWKESVMNFIEDMGMAPAGYEIDREDNYGNYTKMNCRWVTRQVNNDNRRTSVKRSL